MRLVLCDPRIDRLGGGNIRGSARRIAFQGFRDASAVERAVHVRIDLKFAGIIADCAIKLAELKTNIASVVVGGNEIGVELQCPIAVQERSAHAIQFDLKSAALIPGFRVIRVAFDRSVVVLACQVAPALIIVGRASVGEQNRQISSGLTTCLDENRAGIDRQIGRDTLPDVSAIVVEFTLVSLLISRLSESG